MGGNVELTPSGGGGGPNRLPDDEQSKVKSGHKFTKGETSASSSKGILSRAVNTARQMIGSGTKDGGSRIPSRLGEEMQKMGEGVMRRLDEERQAKVLAETKAQSDAKAKAKSEAKALDKAENKLEPWEARRQLKDKLRDIAEKYHNSVAYAYSKGATRLQETQTDGFFQELDKMDEDVNRFEKKGKLTKEEAGQFRKGIGALRQEIKHKERL